MYFWNEYEKEYIEHFGKRKGLEKFKEWILYHAQFLTDYGAIID